MHDESMSSAGDVPRSMKRRELLRMLMVGDEAHG
jgi:hypothetical protein